MQASVTSGGLASLSRRYLRHLLRLVALGCWLGLGQVAQAQTWQKAVAAAGSGGEYRVAATAADAAGNVYIAGSFGGTVQFGNSVLTSPSNSFGVNAFVAKWSAAANGFVWAQQVQGMGSDYATAVAVQGNAVYVAGYFYSSTASLGSISLANAGSFSSDLFVAKLLDAGTSASFAWAQRAGGSGSEVEAGLVVSGSSLYVAGQFEGQVNFGPTTLTSLGGTDAFVAKLTDAGATASFTWAQAVGSTSPDAVYALAGAGPNVYLTGYFRGPTANFGAIALANASTPSTYDAFVAKLVDAGSTASFAWAQRAGGTARDIGYAVAVNGTSVYVAGIFEPPTASFGNLTLTADPANTDAFVAKLTDAGSSSSFVWVQPISGPSYELPMGLASAGAAVYVAGYFGAPTATLGSTTLTSQGSNDLFVARLTDAGAASSYNWVQQAGGPGPDFCGSLALVGSSLYVGGSLTLPARFGSQQLSGPSVTSSSFTGYWALLTDPLQSLAATPAAPASTATLYPNPARAAVTVRLAAPAGAAYATLTVLAATGQLVRTQQVPLPASEAALSVQGLAPGLYWVRVQAGEWQATQALAVE